MPPHWQEKKKEFKEEIEMKSDDWIEHTWLPLKRNSKRKEFWALQLWPIGKLFILYGFTYGYFNRLFGGGLWGGLLLVK